MILRRILTFLAGASVLSVSAGVCVVALAFALYALVEPYAGRAGAAAVVAGAAALLIGLVGVVLINIGKPPRRKAAEPQTFVNRIVDMVKEKPVTAVAAAVAAGVLAVRNPKYLGAAVRAFVEGRNPPRR